MSDDVTLMKDLSDSERVMFQSEVNARRKEFSIAFLLCFFFGLWGGHWFYMGDTKKGILYAVFFWTLVPGILAIIDLFRMSGRVREHNEAVTAEVLAKIKALRT